MHQSFLNQLLDEEHHKLFNETMESIAKNACIRFRKTDGDDGHDYIDILNSAG